MTRVVIVVQARTGSTRLPGKVLLDVAGRPMLSQQLRRLKACRSAAAIVVATSTLVDDDAIVTIAREESVAWFRGSESDVLSRYLDAARASAADVVVRVTADCPLIDPELTDRVAGELVAHSEECDYASNVVRRTFPRGLDAEAFFFDTLIRMDRLARSAAAREHVTALLVGERPELFLTRSIEDTDDNSDLRWTVDTAVDLDLVRRAYDDLGLGERIAPYAEMLAYFRSRPELAASNLHVGTWDPRSAAVQE